jgi:soluble lytic murein transglycosylase-like protein
MEKRKIIVLSCAIALSILLLFSTKSITKSSVISIDDLDSTEIVNHKPEIQMYYFIKKYSQEYNIPEAYAFSLAYQETRYRGPFDSLYKHNQSSKAGALGPMQIMPATAKLICGKPISNKILKNDIKLNVMISMKLLRRLHDKYKNWGLVFGAYNTGRPCVNKYSKRILKKQFNWAT